MHGENRSRQLVLKLQSPNNKSVKTGLVRVDVSSVMY
jgi:hypothetical protein